MEWEEIFHLWASKRSLRASRRMQERFSLRHGKETINSIRLDRLSQCARRCAATLHGRRTEVAVWEEQRHPGAPQLVLSGCHSLRHVLLHDGIRIAFVSTCDEK